MTILLEDLRQRLVDYDGRAVTLLGEAEAALGADPDYLDVLIALVSKTQGHVASGATWLLKSALEKGQSLSGRQVAALCEGLSDQAAWDVQLHICQCIQYLTISGDCAARLVAWLEPLLHHDRPFLRAWSVDALYRISRQHPAYSDRFEQALAVAKQDTAASVRARARKLL